MSAVAPPTRRELVIVTLLLVFLLVFRSNDHSSLSPQPSSPVGLSNNNSATPPGVLHTGSPQSLRARLSWGTSPVPQTKVLGHVPGQSPTPCDRVRGLLTTMVGFHRLDHI